MKKFSLLLIILVTVISIDIATHADDKPKIYIRALIAAKDSAIPQTHTNLISQFFENSMIKMIKAKYDVMSHSTAKAMMTEKEELDALDCNDEACMQTVIKAIQSEYLVYGEIQSIEKSKYIISVKLMHRKQGGLAVIEGSSIQQIDKVEFNEVTKAAERAVAELLGTEEEKKGDSGSKIADGKDTYKVQPDQKIDNYMTPLGDEYSGKASAQMVQGNRINGNFTSPVRSYQWYKMAGQMASNKTFTLTHNPGVDFDFAVYDEAQLMGKAESTSPTDSINVAAVKGTCYVKVWNFRGAGNYSIDVSNFMDPKIAAQKVSGMVFNGNFTSPVRTEQWFKLMGQEGTTPTFTIHHDPMNDFDFSVYRDDTLVSSAQGTNPNDSLTCYLPGGGHTYVKVWNYKGAGPYSININREGYSSKEQSVGYKGYTAQDQYSGYKSGQDYGYGNKASAKMISGMMIQGYFPSTNKTEHWYKLGGQEGVNPTFTILHDQQSDFDFEVYSNESLACKAQGSYSGDTVKCNVPGTCYVKVYNYKGSGNYTIQIRR